jgi:hypothetical protein
VREAEIEAYFAIRAKLSGGEDRKLKWIGRRNAPDRFFVHVGRVYLIELKAPGEKPRASQEREFARLRTAGADVRVLDSLKAIDAFFEEIEK